MREAKKGKCEKCGEYFYTHEHHILPKSIFGNKGETSKLCPNCHTHFHEYRKKNVKNPEDKEEALKLWTKWLKRISLTVTAILLAYLIIF